MDESQNLAKIFSKKYQNLTSTNLKTDTSSLLGGGKVVKSFTKINL
jgi:hypothetical protein